MRGPFNYHGNKSTPPGDTSSCCYGNRGTSHSDIRLYSQGNKPYFEKGERSPTPIHYSLIQIVPHFSVPWCLPCPFMFICRERREGEREQVYLGINRLLRGPLRRGFYGEELEMGLFGSRLATRGSSVSMYEAGTAPLWCPFCTLVIKARKAGKHEWGNTSTF